MRIPRKDQESIPRAIREAAGFLPQTDVRLNLEADGVRIVKGGPWIAARPWPPHRRRAPQARTREVDDRGDHGHDQERLIGAMASVLIDASLLSSRHPRIPTIEPRRTSVSNASDPRAHRPG